jgi:hypothetical protein
MADEVQQLFARCEPAVPATYAAVIAALREIGPVAEEAKKTSIHLVAGSGFAGAHPQKSRLRLNIRLARTLDGPRVHKSERVSANRFHNEVDLTGPGSVDAELVGWLREAYELSKGRT